MSVNVVVDEGGDGLQYSVQVEEGEEVDISCTATDGNPLPKVFLHHHHSHLCHLNPLQHQHYFHPGEPQPGRNSVGLIKPQLHHQPGCF